MSLETNQSLRLPVIDFSVQSLKPNTPEWESVRSQVQKALEEFGCFEAFFDKIQADKRREVLGSVQELFDLPFETKKRNASKKTFYTYGYGQSIDDETPYEAMTIEDAKIHKNVDRFTNVMWPQGNPSFRKTIQSYTDQLSELDRIIRRMIFESLGIEKHLEEHMASTTYSLRVIKYKELEIGETKKLSLSAHRDQRPMSILSQNQVDGLEVQTKDGQWISGKLSKGSFMVLLGETFSCVLANDRLHCPKHRVTMSGSKPRYMVGLILEPKKDYLFKTPDELVDKEHPLKYKPFYYNDFQKFIMAADAEDIDSALKDFCGV